MTLDDSIHSQRLRVLRAAERLGNVSEACRRHGMSQALCYRLRQRHVEADHPGELLSLDTFYAGKLKGVGKVWPITGCDVASSFAWARLIIGEVTAAAVLAFHWTP